MATFSPITDPIMRPPPLLNLSDELLLRIAASVRGPLQLGSGSLTDTHNRNMAASPASVRDPLLQRGSGPLTDIHGSDIENIRNFRLTCHWLSEVGAECLVRHVDVSPTMDSLDRLDRISRHPSISKGVLAVRVDARYYNPRTASSFQGFLSAAYFKLEAEIRNPRRPHFTVEPGDTSLRQLAQSLHLFQETRSSFRQSGRNSPFRQPGGTLDPSIEALGEMFWNYSQRLFEQQTLLHDGCFSRKVGEAVARMPRAKGLILSDTRPNETGREGLAERHLDARSFLAHGMLERNDWLSRDTQTQRTLPGIPLRLLWELPIACFKAGRPLEHLSINVCVPNCPKWDVSKEEKASLIMAARSLRDVQYIGDYLSWENSPNSSMQRYLRCLTTGENLELLELNMSGRRYYRDYASFVMGSPVQDKQLGLLLADLQGPHLRQPNLRHLVLSGCKLHEYYLTVLLGNLANNSLTIELKSVELVSGKWVRVLDLLPAKATRKSLAHGLAGGECDWLSADEFRSVFRWNSDLHQDLLSESPFGRCCPEGWVQFTRPEPRCAVESNWINTFIRSDPSNTMVVNPFR